MFYEKGSLAEGTGNKMFYEKGTLVEYIANMVLIQKVLGIEKFYGNDTSAEGTVNKKKVLWKMYCQ